MAEELDASQMKIIKSAFEAFDHDREGFILTEHIPTILEMLSVRMDDKSIKNLIKEFDPRNSGKLDFNTFAVLGARFVEPEEDLTGLEQELKEAFRLYDKEGKGYLTVATLRSILRELDDKLSPQDLDMMIEEIDADGSGTVDFEEFMEVMTG